MLEVVSRKARTALDRRLSTFGAADRYAAPHTGWIRAIRDALGMSGADLARRLGVSAPAVSSLERSERDETIRLDTLRRVANALDCTLIYVFLPNRGLEETLHIQAQRAARKQLTFVADTMALEDQAVGISEELVRSHADLLIDAGRVWRAYP